ncbi:nucleotide sugar dehydrogenase [Pelagibius litoralis]|uniref:Nucleotide sugar dehydrogenase n=1 Tax=Pelagibius litoralis TaxID=374515 RepID=A0A967EW22_9PROT|nr:nucleotide sugar dehydrogenase [Pelagibius litoralis]
MPEQPSIAVVGLGYVGLPLAVALSEYFSVVAFDKAPQRVEELRAGNDRTREVTQETLAGATLHLTSEAADISACDVYIVTVPTPVDRENRPDLGAVISASRAVGAVLRPGGVVVYESTVYPGVTEEVCGPILAEASGLTAGRDFFLGYSPERINPGDRRHGLRQIVKVVAGQTPEVTDYLAEIYGRVTEAGVFRAADIKTAEAAKVIENAQRDINIAFVNEVTKIFNRMDLSIYDVLEAARTKWNFLDFRPGMVGGHCIGVDPYYLAHCSEALGLHPQVILAGRRTNDSMGTYFAGMVAEALRGRQSRRVLVLGLTFKENVPDLRNSKAADLISALRQRGYDVSTHDPLADPQEALDDFGLEILPSLDGQDPFDCVVGAVAHDAYRDFASGDFASLLVPDGLAFDLRNMWDDAVMPPGRQRRSI